MISLVIAGLIGLALRHVILQARRGKCIGCESGGCAHCQGCEAQEK